MREFIGVAEDALVIGGFSDTRERCGAVAQSGKDSKTVDQGLDRLLQRHPTHIEFNVALGVFCMSSVFRGRELRIAPSA